MIRRLSAVLLPALMAASAAAAQAPSATEDCVPHAAVYARAALMQITSGTGVRAFLQDKARPCPTTAACPWRRKAYLTQGDVVLASQALGGFRCVYHASPRGKLTAGFVAVAFLKPMAEPPAADLAGKWRSDDGAVIEIKARGAVLRATGDASYMANSGGFDGPVTPTPTGFTVADDSCTVAARRRGPYLAVSDNGMCGGYNVSFGGLYTKGR